jgi:hypothetical protein
MTDYQMIPGPAFTWESQVRQYAWRDEWKHIVPVEWDNAVPETSR